MRCLPQRWQSAMQSFVTASSQSLHFLHRRIRTSFICAIGVPQHRAERQTFFLPKNQRLGSNRFSPTSSQRHWPLGHFWSATELPWSTANLLSGHPLSGAVHNHTRKVCSILELVRTLRLHSGQAHFAAAGGEEPRENSERRRLVLSEVEVSRTADNF